MPITLGLKRRNPLHLLDLALGGLGVQHRPRRAWHATLRATSALLSYSVLSLSLLRYISDIDIIAIIIIQCMIDIISIVWYSIIIIIKCVLLLLLLLWWIITISLIIKYIIVSITIKYISLLILYSILLGSLLLKYSTLSLSSSYYIVYYYQARQNRRGRISEAPYANGMWPNGHSAT